MKREDGYMFRCSRCGRCFGQDEVDTAWIIIDAEENDPVDLCPTCYEEFVNFFTRNKEEEYEVV